MRLSDLVRRFEWKDAAACATDDASLNEAFFTQSEAVAADLAKRFCNECPVIDDCVTFAVHYRSEYGVWGGVQGDELMRRVRRRRRKIDTDDRTR